MKRKLQKNRFQESSLQDGKLTEKKLEITKNFRTLGIVSL